MRCGIGSYGYSIGVHNELRDVYVRDLDTGMDGEKHRERATIGGREWMGRQ